MFGLTLLLEVLMKNYRYFRFDLTSSKLVLRRLRSQIGLEIRMKPETERID